MHLELIPDPGQDGRAARVVAAALAQEGLDGDGARAGGVGVLGSAWCRAAIEEAVERGQGFGGRRGEQVAAPPSRRRAFPQR